MTLRDHQIIEWNGSLAEGRATLRCHCGWVHTETTTETALASDAALAAYRTHKQSN